MTTIRRPRHDSGIEIGPEIDREAEVRRRSAADEIERSAQAVEAPFGFENLPPAEQELYRLREVSRTQFGGEREFGSYATVEEQTQALRERLVAQSRSVERTVAQPTQDIQQVAAGRGVQLTGPRRTGEQVAAGRALEQEVAAGAVPVTVTETLREQQQRAQRNPMTYLNIISTIADPFGYVAADLGAMAGRAVGGDIGELAGGIIGGIAGPIPRNPIRGASRFSRPGAVLGVDVLPGVATDLQGMVRHRLERSQGIQRAATQARRAVDRVSPIGTARAASDEAAGGGRIENLRRVASGESKNFRSQLNQYSPTVFREMSADEAMGIIGRASSTPYDPFVATSKDLALGQGQSRGVMAEFSSEGLEGLVNLQKPGSRPSIDEFGTAELMTRDVSFRDLGERLIRMEITPQADARTRRIIERRFQNNLPDTRPLNLERQADGTLVITRKGVGRSIGDLARAKTTIDYIPSFGADERLFRKPLSQLTDEELTDIAPWVESLSISSSPGRQRDGERMLAALDREAARRGYELVPNGPKTVLYRAGTNFREKVTEIVKGKARRPSAQAPDAASTQSRQLGDSVLRAIRNGDLPNSGAYDEADVLRAQIDTLKDVVDSRASSGRVVRPRWATGISDEELALAAKAEGKDPSVANWGADLDPAIRKSLRSGVYKYPNTKTLTVVRKELRDLRRQLKDVASRPRPETVRRPLLAQLEEAIRQARSAGDEETVRHLTQQSRQAILGTESLDGSLTGGIIPPEDANLVRGLVLEAQSKRVASETVQHAADKKRLLDEARAADKEAKALTDHWLNYNAAEEAGMFDDYLTTARAGSGDALTASTRDSARLAEQAREVAEAEVAGTRALSGNAPPRKPGTPRGSGSGTPPRDPAMALADDLDIPPYEKPERFFLQKMDGAIKTRANELNLFGQDAERLRKSLGFEGKLTREDGEPILKALHGELPLSQLTSRQRTYFDLNAGRRNMIQDETIAFLKNAAEGDRRLLTADIKTWLSRILATPEYFPRLWKAREVGSSQGRAGGFGRAPGAARSRNERTFAQMLEDGWEPVSWDPADMIILADYERTVYRQQIVMANALRRNRVLLPLSEARELGFTEPRGIAGRGPKVVSGWRKPEGIGTVFDGRQIPDPANPGEFIKAEAFVMPNDTADTLEIMFGPRPKVTVHGVDVMPAVRHLSNNLKRIKVISLFQDVDIAMTRTLAASFSGRGGVVMGPWRHASLLAQWAAVRTMPRRREALRRLFMSNEKILPGISNSPTYRQVSESGLGIFGDATFIDREILRATREIAASRGGRVPEVVMKRLRAVQEFYEEGLFEGVYPLAARHYMEHKAVRNIALGHPDWTPEQVAASVAKETNKALSTQGVWQSAVKGRVFRQIAGLVLFSPNELESLVGQALSMFRGNEKLFWQKHFLAMYLGMATIGNVINIAATGKPLPAESYSPVKMNDPYALWGVGYNNRFMSPQAPVLRGRNDQPVYIDLVGQMDTVFMLLADPFEAMASRLNVLPRTVANWYAGSSFIGQKNDTLLDKSVQAAIDLGVPISGNSALSVFQQHSEKFRDIVPQQEGRIGTSGNVIQGLTGVNIRGTTTRELLDSAAERQFGVPYEALEPYQKRDVRQGESVSPELQERSQEGRDNIDVSRAAFSRFDEIDRERIAEEENLLKLRAERKLGIDELRTRYFDIQREAQIKREERGLDIDDRSEAPGSPNEAALEAYYAVFEQAETDRELDRLLRDVERSWNEEQQDYVLRNTNDTVHAEGIFRLLPASTRRRISQSEKARQRHLESLAAS